jgi:flagellar basal body rod protein FlgB
MNLLSLAKDNISDLLVRIIEFTHTRQQVLAENIRKIDAVGFTPKDLAVGEFGRALNGAIVEHVQNQRLILRDTDNIKFGADTSLQVTPIVDEYANELLAQNKYLFLELQINKLLENQLNRRIAEELLKQKQQTFAFFDQCAADKPAIRQSGPKFMPMFWDKTQY